MLLSTAMGLQEMVNEVKLKHSCTGRFHVTWMAEDDRVLVEGGNSTGSVAASNGEFFFNCEYNAIIYIYVE